MKSYPTKFSQGALYICSKCGKDFNQSDFAEDLKTSLREKLKEGELNKKIRVMVSGCLGLCIKGQQAVVYHPNQGQIELYAIENPENASGQIYEYIKGKIQN